MFVTTPSGESLIDRVLFLGRFVNFHTCRLSVEPRYVVINHFVTVAYVVRSLIPTSQVTGAADVSASLTWTSNDNDMRTRMQLVLQRLGSDKTKTATGDEPSGDIQTYVFTREATAFLTTHDHDLDVIRPATFDEASARMQEAKTRLAKTRTVVQGSVDQLPQSDWECPPPPRPRRPAGTCAQRSTMSGETSASRSHPGSPICINTPTTAKPYAMRRKSCVPLPGRAPPTRRNDHRNVGWRATSSLQCRTLTPASLLSPLTQCAA